METQISAIEYIPGGNGAIRHVTVSLHDVSQKKLTSYFGAHRRFLASGYHQTGIDDEGRTWHTVPSRRPQYPEEYMPEMQWELADGNSKNYYRCCK